MFRLWLDYPNWFVVARCRDYPHHGHLLTDGFLIGCSICCGLVEARVDNGFSIEDLRPLDSLELIQRRKEGPFVETSEAIVGEGPSHGWTNTENLGYVAELQPPSFFDEARLIPLGGAPKQSERQAGFWFHVRERVAYPLLGFPLLPFSWTERFYWWTDRKVKL